MNKNMLLTLNILVLIALSSTASAQNLSQTPRVEVPKLRIAQNVISKPLKASPRFITKPTFPSLKNAEATTFRWAGEELYYSIRLSGIEAVRAAIKVGELRHKGKDAYVPVVGSAQSVGFFHAIYPMHDTANTFVDPATLRPRRSEKMFEEKGKKRTYKVDFQHAAFQAKVLKKKFAVQEGDKEIERAYLRAIPGSTHDMITWFFELRKKGKMKVGEAFSFYLYDGWKLSLIEGKVVGKEDVYTPIGWFKTYKIDLTREILRSKWKKKGEAPELSTRTPAKSIGSIFISRDENLIPVAVRIPTKWGSSEIVLMKYKLPKKARRKKTKSIQKN